MGVGINDSELPVHEMLACYKSWSSMLERCYSQREQLEYPSYRGCTVDESWLRLSAFQVWFNANYREGYVLDKDILVPGNKHYGPNTCRYVPPYINTLILERAAGRGLLPLGVTLAHNRSNRLPERYRAQLMKRNRKVGLGTHATPEEAHLAYLKAKHDYVCEVANQHFDDGSIDADVRDALMCRYLIEGIVRV